MTQQQNVDVAKIFSSRLVELRGKRSKAEFARFLGVSSPQTYQNYEGGRVPEPDTLINIADKCGCTVDWLLGRDTPHILRESPGEWQCFREPGAKKTTYTFLISWTTTELERTLESAYGAQDWLLVSEIASLLQERKKSVPVAAPAGGGKP